MIKQSASIQSAAETAFSIFEELGEELRDWHDNLPENLQSSDRADRIDEAANTLEGLRREDLGDIPARVAERIITLNLPVLRRRCSRRDRCGEATAYLYSIMDDLDRFIVAEEARGVDVDEVRVFRDELQCAIDEAEGIEFPGMFG